MTTPENVLDERMTLLDVVDCALRKGVVLMGDITISVADVELVYLRLQAVVCAFNVAQREQLTCSSRERLSR